MPHNFHPTPPPPTVEELTMYGWVTVAIVATLTALVMIHDYRKQKSRGMNRGEDG